MLIKTKECQGFDQTPGTLLLKSSIFQSIVLSPKDLYTLPLTTPQKPHSYPLSSAFEKYRTYKRTESLFSARLVRLLFGLF